MGLDIATPAEFKSQAEEIARRLGLRPFLFPGYGTYDCGFICYRPPASAIVSVFWEHRSESWRPKVLLAGRHDYVDDLLDDYFSENRYGFVGANRPTIALSSKVMDGQPNPSTVANNDDLGEFLELFELVSGHLCEIALALADLRAFLRASQESRANVEATAVTYYLLGEAESAFEVINQVQSASASRSIRDRMTNLRAWVANRPPPEVLRS